MKVNSRNFKLELLLKLSRISFNTLNVPDLEEKNVAECIVAKNRHGEIGTVKLQWLPQYVTFADREWKHAE